MTDAKGKPGRKKDNNIIRKDTPAIPEKHLGLADWITDYLQATDVFFANRGIEPEYVVELGPAPTFEIAIATAPGSSTAALLLASTGKETPETLALLVRIHCEVVTCAFNNQMFEAATVNAMRLERYFLKLEYALRIESFARAGLKTARNLSGGSSAQKARADQEVLDGFAAWQRRVVAQLHGKNAAQRLKLYLKTKGSQISERQKRRLHTLQRGGRIPPP
jgi:hypothetical protein